MFVESLKLSMRHFKKNVLHSLINGIGLTLGLACSTLILLWVHGELRMNKFHEKIDELYLVQTITHYGSEVRRVNGTVPALGPALKEDYKEVTNSTRLNNGDIELLVRRENKVFKEMVLMADPSMFEIFSFPLAAGDHRDGYDDSHTMILDEPTAEKYFGSENPVGKTVTVDDTLDFRIIGVMKEIPASSTIRFKCWIPLTNTRKFYRSNYIDTWYNMAFRTYVTLEKGVDGSTFNEKIKDRIRKSDPNTALEPALYPFKDVYLSLYDAEEQVRLYSFIALLIISIAIINFVNLSTARSSRRAKEVGIRKVVGAERRQLVRQFMGESTLYTIFALCLALFLVSLTLPGFRSLTGRSIHFSDLGIGLTWLEIIGITLLTGLISGCIPAFILSSYKPIDTLRGMFKGNRGAWFRKILVVFQFTASVVLIIMAIIFTKQLRFIRNKELGFDKEHVLYVRIEGALGKNYNAMKAELLTYHGILNVSVTSNSLEGVYMNGHGWDWEGRDPNIDPLVTDLIADSDFLETMKIDLLEGEFFRPDNEFQPYAVINECFAKIIGLSPIVGQRINYSYFTFPILGVVKDFHYTPVSNEIGPVVIFTPLAFQFLVLPRYMFIRIAPGSIQETLNWIEKVHHQFNPTYPFEFHFLDDRLDRLYVGIERVGRLVQTFAFLAVLISCLGLFGLASFMAEQRTKEIGVRKVMGASISGIVVMMGKTFVKWVIFANIIAWPFAYWYLRNWLQEYPYRVSLTAIPFISAALIVLCIAFCTVSYQSWKAARTNPVDTLRHE